ncbi:hypothetical protein [Isoptericola sp. NPDC056134]|uniref:hypothetical protein n=1 Tax=Isoptericola sp. NPDC056134 TaxID=3345723 RepID=UPI0035E6C530
MAVYPSSTFGVPYKPPAPYVPNFRGLRHIVSRWDPEHEDADGDGWVETWDLSDPEGGVYFPDADIGGMHLPPFERQTSSSPALSGQRLKGVRTAARPFGWTVRVWKGDPDDTSAAFEAFDAAIWSVIGDPEQPFRWTVETPAGTRRHLYVSYAGGDHAYSRDPMADGWVDYEPEFVADDPYWYDANPIVQEWHQPEQRDFYEPEDADDLLHISQSASTSSAQITNPGKVAAHLKLEVLDQMEDVTISVAGGIIGTPDVADGQVLVVDTDPRVGSADLDGVDVDDQMIPWDPRPIPAGKTVPVTIVASGAGWVRATFIPRYYRAWG